MRKAEKHRLSPEEDHSVRVSISHAPEPLRQSFRTFVQGKGLIAPDGEAWFRQKRTRREHTSGNLARAGKGKHEPCEEPRERTGLFRYIQNEDDLAAVLGHEMAHNIARHAGEKFRRLSCSICWRDCPCWSIRVGCFCRSSYRPPPSFANSRIRASKKPKRMKLAFTWPPPCVTIRRPPSECFRP